MKNDIFEELLKGYSKDEVMSKAEAIRLFIDTICQSKHVDDLLLTEIVLEEFYGDV